MSNHLKNETSPYLLQHVNNPVDWYPWGDEAFRRAKDEDKPIFLSIGYSTCHWCHVMAHESFEDEEIAEILKKHFISIKVDREERPDIDSIYMTVCQAFTGSGGWPTSIFMTPEQKPFFAGTYFPKNNRGGMIGLKQLLMTVHEKWTTEREALLEQANHVVDTLSNTNHAVGGKADTDIMDSAVVIYKKLYDKKYGGFGDAPKFPTPHNLLFLLSYYERYKDRACLEMAEHTLLQMYRGGMFDHIGFGFSRYSTDKYFLVPHFEKMLYDNALLILAYCKAYSVTKKEIYLEIAKKTATYILSEMTSPDGAFYSAQDADSDGEEGKYYVFTPDEIISILGEENGEAFNHHFGISRHGNFEGKSIPNLLKSDYKNKSFEVVLPQIEKYRKARCALHLDDKILTLWNSLMIAALCMLYRVSCDKTYLSAAQNTDRFIKSNLCDGDTLFVSFRAGKHGEPGFLDDYAAYIYAQLSLYSATLDTAHLELAERLCNKVLANFKDDIGAGFYLYGLQNEKLILRPKETYDGAIPSGNSLMAWNLVRLSHLTGNEKYMVEAERQLDFIASDAEHYPPGYSMFLSALLEYYEPPAKVTVVLEEDAEQRNLQFDFPAGTLVIVLSEPTKEYPLKDGKTTYYACKGHSCLPPTNNIKDLT